MNAGSMTCSPRLEIALAAVAELSREEKVVLVERVEADLGQTADISDWEDQLVGERLRLLEEGLSVPVPWEEVKTRLGRKWGKK